MHGYLTRADAHALLQLGYGGATAPGGVDLARVDVGARPTEATRFQFGAVYRGNAEGEITAPGAPIPGVRNLAVQGSASVLPLPNVDVALQGGYIRDLTTVLTQARVGPVFTFLSLLGPRGALQPRLRGGVRLDPGPEWQRRRHRCDRWTDSSSPRASWFRSARASSAEGLVAQEMSAPTCRRMCA